MNDAICGCIVWPCGLMEEGCEKNCPFKPQKDKEVEKDG
jgi:hypothetical protein